MTTASTVPLVDFIHGLRFEDMPAAVVERARLCLLDLLGVALAGRETEMSRIARDHAVEFFGGRAHRSRLLFDGRRASPGGAAFAGAMTIDSMDGHDGHAQAKGHVGVVALPALAALTDDGRDVNGPEFLVNLVLGYEIGTRPGVALHATSPDYHSSGAWNALAAAAIGARLLRLDRERTRHALGIAEYHGPRSQMMRCIDHPTMVKDGSGWGALSGVNAAYLAQDGFTGAPAITAEREDVETVWADLGRRWRLLEQYIKPYPVCRWAHPAIEAALGLLRAHDLRSPEIRSIEITTFHAAARLAHPNPATTEEAQYSLSFPVASALVFGDVGTGSISGASLHDPEVLRLSNSVTTVESAAFEARFPAERWASVVITRHDGTVLRSGPTRPRGDPDRVLDAGESKAKMRGSRPVDDAFVAWLEDHIARLAAPSSDTGAFLDLILRPPPTSAR
jgi:2-methylcitrate dehydratase PrpD